MERQNTFSFKELLEKREKIMREKDEYIEIPLDDIKENTPPVTKNKSTMTEQPVIQYEPLPVKKSKNKSCKYVGCTIALAGFMVLNDYLLLTYFV